MSDKTNISWCDSTGGPWFGCTEVSAGCANCYARELTQNRFGQFVRSAYAQVGFKDWQTRPVWGDKAPRVLTNGFWKDIPRFNKKPWVCQVCGHAMTEEESKGYRGCPNPDFINDKTTHRMVMHVAAHRRREIFPSLIDWLDPMPAGCLDRDGNWIEPAEALARFLTVVFMNDQVRWLLLSKRPELFHERLKAAVATMTCDPMDIADRIQAWVSGEREPTHVAIGATCENQEQADKRIPELLKIPAHRRFLSLEPLLGAVDFDKEYDIGCGFGVGHKSVLWEGIHWLIAGGESGPKARPCNVEWIRSLVRQGQAAGVRTLVKQLGLRPVETITNDRGNYAGFQRVENITHPKGGDPSEWPEDLRVQERLVW